MAELAPLHVLVVDDDADTRSALSDVLSLDDHRVETAGSVAEVLARNGWDVLDAVVLDRKLPDGTAEELLPRLKELAPRAAVIIVTGHADLEGAIAAIRQGAADYLLKPINLDVLRNRLAGLAAHKRAEATIADLNRDLRRRAADLHTLLDLVPVGIALAEDPDGRAICVNRSFARLLRLKPDHTAPLTALPTNPPFRFLREGKEVLTEDLPLRRAAAGVEVRDAELDVAFADGTIVNLLVQASPLPEEHGQPRGAVGAFLDVTGRKIAQERLLQTERLAAIGQMVTGLAHESGNALARSGACLEMLAMEVEDRPEALDLVGRARQAQNHLQQLYEEVRGYAAPIKLECEPLNLRDTWRQAWTTLELARRGRDVTLREEMDGIEPMCRFDGFRIQQVFRNVLENALAACKDPVEIAVACSHAVVQGRPAVCVAVRDNGSGLNSEQKRRIFEPFYTTKTKGTGLGMAIVKRIIEAHGGQIAVGTGRSRGAEILITLPREGP